MKYESVISLPLGECSVECLVKGVDVMAYRHAPAVLCKRVAGANFLNETDIDYIYSQIAQIIETTDEELETIESVARAVAKGCTVEVSNSLLARWAHGVCLCYVNYADEHGLLSGVRWEDLGYWHYLTLVQLQRACVEECNKRLKSK